MLFPSLSSRPAILAGIALALAVAGMAFQYQRAERFKAEVQTVEAQAKASLTLLAREYQAQSEALATCQNSARKFADLYDGMAETAAAAVDSLAKTRSQLNAARSDLAKQEAKDNAIPECQALLDTRLGVCPATVAGLRKRAAGGLPGQGERNPGSRLHETAALADGRLYPAL